MNFITLKELKKMVPVASEFKRVPGLKKILEDGIEVILRKQMENHAEVVVYKNGYVSYHAHERYTVFALHNCTHYYYESQGNEHQTIPHNHFEDMEWHIRLVLEGEDRLVRNLEARESETFSYAADVNPEYNNEMEDPRINVMDFVLNKEFLRKASELLKKHQWEMICRHYIEGMTHREIAAEMGVSHQYVTKGMMVCVAIYAALIGSIRVSSDIHSALFGTMAYTVILCFSLLKTGSLSKQIFGSH